MTPQILKHKLFTKLTITFFVFLFAFPASSTYAAIKTTIFKDDFNDDVINSQLVVKNYTLEDSGSFGPFTELTLVETGGEIKISGTGTIDTVIVDGQIVGWIGKSLMFTPSVPLDTRIAVETQVKIIGGNIEFAVGLTIEFDTENRIVFNLGYAKNPGKFINLTFDEFNTSRCGKPGCTASPFPFVNEQVLTLRLEFDPINHIVTGIIDGVPVLEDTYYGKLANPQVGLIGTVRSAGDVLDGRFDYLLIEQIEEDQNSLLVPDIKQYSPPWNDDVYNQASRWSNNPTIEKWGCALTSGAMILQYYNHYVDPGSLNNWLNIHNGYTRNGGLWWPALTRYSKTNSGDASPTLEYEWSAYDSLVLEYELSQNRPVIVKHPYPMHFIVARGKSGSDFLINDPGVENHTFLSQSASTHSNPDAIRLFKPTNSDLSYLGLAIDADTELEVFDPRGKEIKNYSYIQGSLTNNNDGAFLNSEVLKIFQYPKPEDGLYTIYLSGHAGNYQLDSYIHAKNGEVNFDETRGTIKEGKKDIFLINLNKENLVNSNISEVSFKSILIDLKEAYKNGSIRNRAIYKSLQSLIKIAQRLLNRGHSRSANKLLNITLHHIRRYTPRFIDTETSFLLQTKIKLLRGNL